jgi:Ca2+-binding RTX toxin-like protein
MKRHTLTTWLVLLAAALGLAVGAGVAADYAAASHKAEVEAKIKRGILEVEGTRAGEEIVLRLRAGDPTILEIVTPSGVLAFPRDQFTAIEVEAGDGDDLVRIDQANGVFTDTEATTLDGEGDEDDLRGGSGPETLKGGSGDDAADGNVGADIGLLGRGDDSFTWDPGDGSDRVEGSRGDDTLVFNGAGGAENFDVSANGERLRFFRNLGNIVMDVDDTERVDLRALGGADNTVLNDVSRTDLEELEIDLAAAIGGTAGDLAADTVTLFGSERGWSDDDDRRRTGDEVTIVGADGSVSVDGLSAFVRIAHAEPALDLLDVRTLGGDDEIDASALAASAIKLALDGGEGDDDLRGGAGNDALAGSFGDDDVDGNQGADSASLGLDDDSFTWDPGDGSDVVEGGNGSDRMIFNGAAGNEILTASAVGGRVEFLRNLGNIDMDLNDVERIDLNPLGGTDQTNVNDLSGTDLEDVNVDLAGVIGGRTPDGAADTVTMNATAGVDIVDIQAVKRTTRVSGLAATVRIANADPALDRLVLNTLAGLDQVTVGAGVAALIGVTVSD